MFDNKTARIETSFGPIDVFGIEPRDWPTGGYRCEPGDATDVHFFGEGTIRIETGQKVIPSLPIKITPRNPQRWTYSRYSNCRQMRVRIEFLADGEPSTFTPGIVYFQ
jgi:hypothetical protein